MAATTTAPKPSRQKRHALLIGPGGPWHEQAPPRVCQAYQTEAEQGWAAWRQHLATRKLRPLIAWAPGKASPLTWALPDGSDLSQALELIALLGRLQGSKRRNSPAIAAAVANWLASSGEIALCNGQAGTIAQVARDAAWPPLGATAGLSSSAGGADKEPEPGTPDDSSLGFECLAWCGALSQLTAYVPEPLWWNLLNRLVAIASADVPLGDPLAAQLLASELPLSLAFWFSELAMCRALAEAGRRTLYEGIAELLDGEGLLHSKHVRLLRPLLASWTRSRALGQAIGESCWNQDAQRQYGLMVQSALRLSRSNGQGVFTSAASRRWNPDLAEAAVKLAGDRATRRIARLVAKGVARSKTRGDQLPSPALEGEWAGLAVLRCDWTRSSPRLTVAYGGPDVAMELSVGDRCLWSGPWGFEVRFNGQPLTILGDWEQVCWESDGDVDYLELSVKLSDEVTIERHLLLARDEGFVFLADAVLGIQQGTIEYRGTLPLAGFSSFQGAAETRDGSLVVGRRTRAWVMPLELSEWRCARSRGSLQGTERGLELEQSADAQSLFAPLFIDLDAVRLRREATWRQLTIAQNREIEARDTAVGYRVQAGKSQWLVYRSLAPADIRSVLGTSLMHEFLLAKFQADGQIKRLLEIESE